MEDDIILEMEDDIILEQELESSTDDELEARLSVLLEDNEDEETISDVAGRRPKDAVTESSE